MGNCVICKSVVDWNRVKEEFGDILDQVDVFGPDSLTENEQVVYEGACCSNDCFERLD